MEIIITVDTDKIDDLFEAFIKALEKCKCGIPSHEYKVNKIIEDWKNKITKWKKRLLKK